MTPRVRLQEVAELAGVSVATASTVARGDESGPIRVSDDTRARVLEAIETLGYKPNLAARALRTQRTGIVAIVVPDLTNPLFPQFVRAAQLQTEAGGGHLMVWDTDRDADRERAAVVAIVERQIDGVVLITDHLGVEDLEPLRNAGIAIATTDRRLNLPDVDIVSEDLTGTAKTATDHLISLGHRRIAHVAGDRTRVAGESRVVGYLDALDAAGIDPDPALIVGGTFTRETGEEAGSQLLALQEPPTAIFAANDAVAIGVLHACHRLGVAVPDDVSVIGIDNARVADIPIPGLTTMDPKPSAIAQRLVELVMARSASESEVAGARELFTATLVERGTTQAQATP